MDALNKVGIKTTLYYVFEEELFEENPQHVKSEFDEYEICSLGPQDMQAISAAAIPDRKESEDYLLQRLKRGPKCLGVKYRGKIVAFSWYDLTQCNFGGHIFTLKANEACLFDAYTLSSHRGKGLAPLVRYEVYKELSKLGRNILLSSSDFFNVSAIRFKRKLNAKLLELRHNIRIRWVFFSIRIKRYRPEALRIKRVYYISQIRKYKISNY